MEEKKLCDYGCGKPGLYQFKNRKWCCSRYLSKCPAVIKKNKISHKGRKFSEEHRRKMSESGKKKIMSIESRTKISNTKKGSIPWNKGLKEKEPRSEEYKRKMSERTKGIRRSDEFKLQTSIRQKGEKHWCYGKKKSEESKIKCSITMKKKFTEKEFLEKFYNSVTRKPNKPENILIEILDFLDRYYFPS